MNKFYVIKKYKYSWDENVAYEVFGVKEDSFLIYENNRFTWINMNEFKPFGDANINLDEEVR